ncbi:hypothetical protein [Anatilimnocola aggregata]|uniref:hypothetical protein n=1 Tax=Anatilimnocola aggregata TaxID=2528021 RepID=UPI0011A37C12|nr:hypothetical protein [Anatilimnocola aggregata]
MTDDNPYSSPSHAGKTGKQDNIADILKLQIVWALAIAGLACVVYIWCRLRFPPNGRDYKFDLELASLAGLGLNVLSLCAVFLLPKRTAIVALNVLALAWNLAMNLLGPIP